MKISLQLWPVEKLRPYERNTKLHTDQDVSLIRASIEKFGFNDPIGVLPNGEIVEGHGRLEAAKLLGIAKVPVIVLEEMDERGAALYRIAHNKISQTTSFDFAKLVVQLRSLTAGDIEISHMGFTEKAVRDLFRAFPDLSTAAERAGGRGVTLDYDIVWDDESQKKDWTDFVKHCVRTFPDVSSAEAVTLVILGSTAMKVA